MTGIQTLRSPTVEAESISSRVLAAVAEREGITPLELDRPLFEAIDPEALDAIFSRGPTDATVEFPYHGYQVTVRGDTDVELTPLDD